MNPTSGNVEEIGMAAASPDYVSVSFGREPNTYRPVHIMVSTAGMVVNGAKANVRDLFKWLADTTHGHFVTVHPDPMQYGLSKDTEFSDTGT